MIRPMGVPDDVKERSIKMNGYMASKLFEYKENDLYQKNLYVRQEATKFWNRMNYSAKRRLDYLCDKEIKRDLVSTMFVLILQIFGRYAELRRIERNTHRLFCRWGISKKDRCRRWI